MTTQLEKAKQHLHKASKGKGGEIIVVENTDSDCTTYYCSTHHVQYKGSELIPLYIGRNNYLALEIYQSKVNRNNLTPAKSFLVDFRLAVAYVNHVQRNYTIGINITLQEMLVALYREYNGEYCLLVTNREELYIESVEENLPMYIFIEVN